MTLGSKRPRNSSPTPGAARASSSEGGGGRAPVPGEHNVLNALAAFGALRKRRVAGRRGSPPAREIHRLGPALRVTRPDTPGRACTTTMHTTRPRCAPRSRPRAHWSRAGWSRLPAAPTRARGCSRAISAGARAGGPDRGAGRVSRARAARGLSGRERLSRRAGGGGRRRRAPGLVAPASTTPSATCARELAEGDLLLTLGAGNVDELARRLAA